MGSKQKGKENKKIIIIGFWIIILVNFLLFLVTDLDILFYFYVKNLLLKCQLARRCRSYVGMGGFGKKVNEHELSLGYSIFYFSFFIIIIIIIIIILIRIFHFWLIKVRYIFLFF